MSPLDSDIDGEDELMTANSREENRSNHPKSTIKKNKNQIDSYVSDYKKYKGAITSINVVEETFNAILEGDDGVRSEISFSFDDVDEEEKQFIAIHSPILYIFGKQYMNGTAFNFSKIYFRTSGKWNKQQIKVIERRTKELLAVLKKNEIPDD